MDTGMVKRLPVRGLTEGALLACLVAFLAVVAQYFPPLALGTLVGAPLPLTVLVIRHGTRIGVLAAVVAALIGVMIAGPVLGLLIASIFAPLGISTGIAVRRGLAAPQVVIVGSLTLILAMLGNLAISLVVLGVNPITTSLEMAHQSQQMAEQFYRYIGLTPQQIEAATAPMKASLTLAPRIVAAAIVIFGFGFAWFYYAVARRVLGRVRIDLPALPPMTTWNIPAIFVWAFMIGFVLVAVATTLPGGLRTVGETVGLNLLVVTRALFTLQGGIVGWMLMERYSVPRWIRVVLIVLMVNDPVLSIIMFLLGVADSAFRLRQRWSQQVASS